MIEQTMASILFAFAALNGMQLVRQIDEYLHDKHHGHLVIGFINALGIAFPTIAAGRILLS